MRTLHTLTTWFGGFATAYLLPNHPTVATVLLCSTLGVAVLSLGLEWIDGYYRRVRVHRRLTARS